MTNDDASDHEIDRLWQEAAGRVQSDEDIDVLLEARGLMIAEMGDVTVDDRRGAMSQGSQVSLAIRGGTWLSGNAVSSAADHLVLDSRMRSSQRVVVPEHSIIAFADLPRVLHAEVPTSRERRESWQTTLRNSLGKHVAVDMGAETLAGTLTWVGRDHLTLDTERGSITCLWHAVDVLRFDYRTSSNESVAS